MATQNTDPDLEDASLETIFPTYLFRHIWSDSDLINRGLRSAILRQMEDQRVVVGDYTNVGGWHSEPTLQESQDEATRIVIARFERMARELTRRTAPVGPGDHIHCETTAWSNVNRENDYNEMHCHRHCTWVGVYYVEVPQLRHDDLGSAALELFDPRPAAAMIATPGPEFTVRRFFRPVEGAMLIFPGWLNHMVLPFAGEGRRISIACNMRVKLVTEAK